MIVVYFLHLTYNILTFKYISCHFSLSIGQNEAIIATRPTSSTSLFTWSSRRIRGCPRWVSPSDVRWKTTLVRIVLDPYFLIAWPAKMEFYFLISTVHICMSCIRYNFLSSSFFFFLDYSILYILLSLLFLI